MMADLEKTFTLVCPRCGSSFIIGLSELPLRRVRSSVYAWPCQVCEHRVEYSPNGCVTREPRKLTAQEKMALRGKGKKAT